jgi:hypothetical protein
MTSTLPAIIKPVRVYYLLKPCKMSRMTSTHAVPRARAHGCCAPRALRLRRRRLHWRKCVPLHPPSDRSHSSRAALAHLPGPGSADNGACAFLLDACAADTLAVPPALLHKSACVAALPCVAGVQTVDDVLALWLGALAPPAAAEPRLSPNVRPSCVCVRGRAWLSARQVFAQHSSDKKTWSAQDFVDVFYGQLSAHGGPYPSRCAARPSPVRSRSRPATVPMS